MLLSRSDVEDGGETVFPSAATAKSGSSRGGCARRGALSVQPKMGHALLFWIMRLDYRWQRVKSARILTL
jgi:hypothetical protein